MEPPAAQTPAPPAAPPPEAPPKKKRHGCLWSILAAVLLLLVIAIAIPSDEDKDAPPATGDQPAAVVAEEQPAEDNALTAEETAYSTKISEDATRVGEAITTIGELSQEYPWDDSQVLEVAAKMAVIDLTYQEYKKMDAPSARYRPVHREWVAALAAYAKSCKRLAYGADHMDVDAINDAGALMTEGRKHIERATARMDEVMAEL